MKYQQHKQKSAIRRLNIDFQRKEITAEALAKSIILGQYKSRSINSIDSF